MKRITLLALIAGALIVPASAGASRGLGGLGAGGVAACAAGYGVGAGDFAPVTSLGDYPGPPGPFGGPHSVIAWSEGKNNGTSLVIFCQTPPV